MTFKLSPDTHHAPTRDGTVLLNERTNRYWQLNATGALVLEALLTGDTPDQAARRLVAAYPVTAEQADRDVAVLIDALCAARLAVR